MSAEPALELECSGGSVTVRWEGEGLAALDSAEALDAEPPWRLEGDLPEGVELVRVLSAGLEDGRAFGLLAIREDAAEGHGDERISSFIARPGRDPEVFETTRLSTEYDDEGRVRRIGLELWGADDAPPIRAAGDREGVAAVSHGALQGELAALGFRLDGVAGAARYEVLRPA